MAPAVLFDLDGTLTPRSASLDRFALLFAQDFEDSLVPIGIAELTRRLIALDQGGYNPRRAHDLRERLDWRAAPEASALDAYWQRRFPEAVVPQPSLHEVLDELVSRGLRIGIVTNGGVKGQRRKIERLGLADRMHSVIVSDAVGCKKPNPRIFEIACKAVGTDAGDCWFVGDHPENDVLGASRFGMRAVWLTDPKAGFPWPAGEPAPAYRIESLSELPLLLGSGP